MNIYILINFSLFFCKFSRGVLKVNIFMANKKGIVVRKVVNLMYLLYPGKSQ